MIQENISAFKGPHLLLNLMVSGLKAENVAASLKLRNANVQKAYCEKNSSVKNSYSLCFSCNVYCFHSLSKTPLLIWKHNWNTESHSRMAAIGVHTVLIELEDIPYQMDMDFCECIMAL